jgi:FKBP-type peptidyl-prolyl cis-trans isomerase FkpA
MRRTATNLKRVAPVVILLASGACSSLEVTVPEVEFEVIEEVTFDASLGIDLALMDRLPSGVYIQDIVVGEGVELDAGSVGTEADVAYQGWLRTGTLFDQGEFTFSIGLGEVIPGFEQGVAGMKVGGTRLIIIPPELAYGANLVGSIPPGSILVFEVELVAVRALHLG